MKPSSTRLLQIVIPFTLAALAASAGDWSSVQGSNRDARSTETGLLKKWPAEGPTLIWKITDLGAGYSSVAVSRDMICASGDAGDNLMLYAFDLKGQLKWKRPQGPAFTGNRPGSRATPVLDGDRVYVEGANGLLTCHRTTDGKEVWRRDFAEFGAAMPKWGFAESPLVLDQMIIATPGGKTAIVALDKTTGKDVWRSNASGAAHYSSPLAVKEGDSTIIVQGLGGGLVVLDAKDGKQLYSNPFSAKNTANCPSPVYADSHIFWANGYGKGGICLKADQKDGQWTFTEAWTTKEMICHHGGYIIEKGHIYGNHKNGWACLALKDGTVKWSTQDGIGKGSLIFADGMLYMFGEDGGKVALAPAVPDAFKQVSTFTVAGSGSSWAHPAISDGRLYIRYDVNLYCFDIRQTPTR